MNPAAQKLYAFCVARYFDALALAKRRPLVLFFRDGGIGDVLCTLPAASTLAGRHGAAYRIYCTHPSFVGLPRMTGKFDRVVGIRCSDAVALASRRHTVYRFRYPDEEPEGCSSHYLADEFAEAFGLPPGQPWPRLDAGPESPKVEALLPPSDPRPVICIHTGPTWAVREWPRERWEQLVPRLASLGARVLQIGASRHFREGVRREPVLPGVEDCRDVYSLMETLQIVARSRLLVGIDSGMLHAAVAFRVPAVGLFGATSGALRLPAEGALAAVARVECLGCHHRRPRLHWQANCPYGIRCMKELSADVVFEKSQQLFAS